MIMKKASVILIVQESGVSRVWHPSSEMSMLTRNGVSRIKIHRLLKILLVRVETYSHLAFATTYPHLQSHLQSIERPRGIGIAVKDKERIIPLLCFPYPAPHSCVASSCQLPARRNAAKSCRPNLPLPLVFHLWRNIEIPHRSDINLIATSSTEYPMY